MDDGVRTMDRGPGVEFVMRSAASTYVVPGVLLGGPAALCAYVALTKLPSMWGPTAVMLALLVCIVLYIASLRVSLRQGVLSYRRLFGGWSAPLADISYSRVGRVPTRNGRQLILFVWTTDASRALSMNLKPFRLEDIRSLVALPVLKLESAENVP